MAKVAILSDIHGNLRAFRAVLREVAASGVEVLAVAGDIIGYGAKPRECLELAQKLGNHVVYGNHEFYAELVERKGTSALEADWESNPVYAGIVRAVQELKPEQFRWIRTLNWVERIAPESVMAHATLHEPDKWHYLYCAEDARPTLDLVRNRGIELAFFGHTHFQRWFAHPDAPAQPVLEGEDQLFLPKGSICAVTVGSVGQSRGDDGDLRATWVLWDRDSRTIEFRKTSYLP